MEFEVVTIAGSPVVRDVNNIFRPLELPTLDIAHGVAGSAKMVASSPNDLEFGWSDTVYSGYYAYYCIGDGVPSGLHPGYTDKPTAERIVSWFDDLHAYVNAKRREDAHPEREDACESALRVRTFSMEVHGVEAESYEILMGRIENAGINPSLVEVWETTQ